MTNVIDFTAKRLGKVAPPKQVTWEELHSHATEFLLGDWEKMARNNRLNDYFKQSLPNLIDPASKSNYMADLNEVAALEMNLEFFPRMFSPGTQHKGQLGWLVQFHLGEGLFGTPELASEPYARCFAILLYLKLKRDALEAGLL